MEDVADPENVAQCALFASPAHGRPRRAIASERRSSALRRPRDDRRLKDRAHVPYSEGLGDGARRSRSSRERRGESHFGSETARRRPPRQRQRAPGAGAGTRGGAARRVHGRDAHLGRLAHRPPDPRPPGRGCPPHRSAAIPGPGRARAARHRGRRARARRPRRARSSPKRAATSRPRCPTCAAAPGPTRR